MSAAMEEVVHRADGMADAFLHPDIMTYMSEKFRERWEMRRDTFERLSACLLAACAAGPLHEKGRVAVLLGKPEETDWQMELTQNLLLPYLSRINSLLFYYEEVAGTDIWEEMAAYLETYDYEYGLVPAMHPYSTGEQGKMQRRDSGFCPYGETPKTGEGGWNRLCGSDFRQGKGAKLHEKKRACSLCIAAQIS